MKIFIIGFISVLALLAGGSLLSRNLAEDDPDVIAQSGLHWHPELTILIKGKKQEIPANLGIGAVHESLHTHDTTGVLHLEIEGLVKKEDTTLGRFFKIWGKQFNSNCIFSAEGGSASGGEFCNGPDGTVKMFVNGTENKEFENYPMKDKDKIEIRYE